MSDEGVKIPLVNSDQFATVDKEDAEYIRQFTWQMANIEGKDMAVATAWIDGVQGFFCMQDLVMMRHFQRQGRDSEVELIQLECENDITEETRTRFSFNFPEERTNESMLGDLTILQN